MYKIQKVEWDQNNDPVYTDIYNPENVDTLPVIGPKCTLEIGEAGGLQFTLAPGHPLIDSLTPVSTYVRLLDGNDEIFYGKVLQKSDPSVSGKVSFTCSGALSFLLDGEVPPFERDSKGQVIPQTMTAENFFRWCITQYNADVNDPRRQLTVGTVNADKKNVQASYQISAYTQAKSAIESNIINVFGGYLRTRRNNGTLYIDWVQQYETLNAQAITLGTNVIDQTTQIDGTSFFTVLRPVGDNNIVLPEGGVDLFDEADMDLYGRIIKTIQFSGATSVDALRTEATDYKNRIQKQLFAECEIRLVDMYYIDGTSPKIRLGNRFTNIHGMTGIEMIAASLDLNLDAPQNDSVGLKNRRSLEGDLTPEGNAHSKKTMSGSSRHSSGQFFKYLKETGEALEVTAKTVAMHGVTLEQHYEQIETSANNISTLSRRADDVDNTLLPITQTWSAVTFTIATVAGSEVIQNDHTIASVVGNFETWQLPSGRKVVRLKDGSDLEVDDGNGVIQNVGELLGTHTDEIDDVKTFTDLVRGSALWTQRDGITGVAGEFEVVTNPITGTKTLVVKSGGGMKIRRDSTDFGIYDDGTLTGGVVAQKLGDGTVQTTISGDIIDLSTNGGFVSILATTTNIVSSVNQKARVFIQLTDPTLDTGVTVRDGDLWYQRADETTWNELGDPSSGKSWNELSDTAWKNLYGTVHYVRKNNAWVEVADSATILESNVAVEHDNEHWAVLARQMDINQHTYESNLSVTAQQIRSDVRDVESELESNIEQTASSITSMVADKANGLESLIRVTATGVYSGVSDYVNGNFSTIVQTSTNIAMAVKSASDNLQSSINIEHDRIELVVEGTGTNAHIKPAEIVSSINNGASSIIISADHINLDGYVKATDITTDYLNTKIGDITLLNVKSIATSVSNGTSSFDKYYGNHYYFNIPGGGGSVSYRDVKDGIYELTLTQSGDTYTLKKTNYAGTETAIGTFSRATLLSGTWSSNTYTVTASPQGATHSVTPVVHVPVPGAQPTASTTIYVATSSSGGSGYTDHGSGKSVYLVANGKTVTLRDSNSTSGTIYATKDVSDSNLKAANIKDGVTIFGVTGTYEGESYTDKGRYWTCEITQDGQNKTCTLSKNFSASQSIPFTNGQQYHLYT